MLHPFERRTAHPGPACRVNVRVQRSAEFVHIVNLVRERLGTAHCSRNDVLRSFHADGAFGAIVANQIEDHRVLTARIRVDRLQQASNLVVSVGNERGIDLHLPRIERLLLRR